MATFPTSIMPPSHYPPDIEFTWKSEAEFKAHIARLMASGELDDLRYLTQDMGYYVRVQIFPRYRNNDPRPAQRICQGGNDCFQRPGPEGAGRMSDLDPWFYLGHTPVSIYDYLLPLPIGRSLTMSCACPPERSPSGQIVRGQREHDRLCNANASLNGWYVASLDTTWVSQCGDTSGHWYAAPAPHRRGAAGVKGLYGCTAIIIVSEVGAYIAHIWETPAFVYLNHKRKTKEEIENGTWRALRDGTERGCVFSITRLVGTNQLPGPLHHTRSPRVIIVTPWIRNSEGEKRRETRHKDALQVLRKGLESFFGRWVMEFGYQGTDQVRSTEVGFLGRAIVEFDMAKQGFHVDHSGTHWPQLKGRWRVWVEDNVVARDEFDINPLVHRYPGPNPQYQAELARFCWCRLQPQLFPQHREWLEQIRVSRQPPKDDDKEKNCAVS